MQVNITFRHLDSTDALKSHVQDRVDHIQRYIDRPSESHVVLYVQNKKEHHADITVHAGPFVLRGQAKSENMYGSIDQAVDKIERQLKKHKEKMKNHKPTMIPHGWVPMDVTHEILDFDAENKVAPRVVRSSTFQAKPMTVDEAVMQMDLIDNQFLVFQNAKDSAINVLYRREDGNYGLIEARSK